ncbi:hypothetical protein EJ04DRAFT_551082 [Polyplosphaeria fusca]|uniref:Uncharacterized protein n=1 Tax=Polyplosphaeria fusca TaxID=682080 RepID=A0A9P4V1U0_9PLEO|nr:hypothetical protein EJ04DRAFT_551082 [Polyplosphaeria fusca]
MQSTERDIGASTPTDPTQTSSTEPTRAGTPLLEIRQDSRPDRASIVQSIPKIWEYNFSWPRRSRNSAATDTHSTHDSPEVSPRGSPEPTGEQNQIAAVTTISVETGTHANGEFATTILADELAPARRNRGKREKFISELGKWKSRRPSFKNMYKKLKSWIPKKARRVFQAPVTGDVELPSMDFGRPISYVLLDNDGQFDISSLGTTSANTKQPPPLETRARNGDSSSSRIPPGRRLPPSQLRSDQADTPNKKVESLGHFFSARPPSNGTHTRSTQRIGDVDSQVTQDTIAEAVGENPGTDTEGAGNGANQVTAVQDQISNEDMSLARPAIRPCKTCPNLSGTWGT